jgi:transposase
MARYLLATPGVYLLSVPGISVIYAADFTAEVGDIQRFAYAKQLISLAGTCAKKDQTGESDPEGLPISKQGRNLLRATLNHIALSLNAHCPEYTTYYHRKHTEQQDRPKIPPSPPATHSPGWPLP